MIEIPVAGLPDMMLEYLSISIRANKCRTSRTAHPSRKA
jgi:hypothetical protein